MTGMVRGAQWESNCHQLPTANCPTATACHQLPNCPTATACDQLPAAQLLLPATNHQLPNSYCLCPTAHQLPTNCPTAQQPLPHGVQQAVPTANTMGNSCVSCPPTAATPRRQAVPQPTANCLCPSAPYQATALACKPTANHQNMSWVTCPLVGSGGEVVSGMAWWSGPNVLLNFPGDPEFREIHGPIVMPHSWGCWGTP